MGQTEVQNAQLQPALSAAVAGIVWDQNFIAEEVCPPVEVYGEQFMYETYDNAGLVDQGTTKRALNGESKVLSKAQFSTVKTDLEEYSAKLPTDYRLIQAAETQDAIRPVPAAGMSSVDRLRFGNAQIIALNNKVQKEKAVASIVFGSTNYDTALKVTDNSVNFAATGIIKTVQAAIRSVARAYGIKPDTLVLGYTKFLDLLNNPDIIARITGGANNANPAAVDLSLIAFLLGVKRIVVGEPITQTLSVPALNAAPTPGATVTDVWTATSAALLFTGNLQGANIASPAFGKVFYMNVPQTGVRYAVRTWMNDEGNVEWVKATEFWLAAKVMAAGYLWAAAP